MPRTLYTNFLPSADSTHSLGSTDLRWLKLWVDDITMGGLIVGRTVIGAGVYAVLATDYLIAKTAITAGGDTITLDDDLTDAGRTFIIKDESGTAGTNNITIDPEGGTLIDGALTYVMNANYESKTVYSDGTNWFVI